VAQLGGPGFLTERPATVNPSELVASTMGRGRAMERADFDSSTLSGAGPPHPQIAKATPPQTSSPAVDSINMTR
jgi:hypothetical protein